MSEEELDRRILEHLEPFTIILDIGCGDGHLVNALVAQKGCRVIGLDSSDHGFVEAKMAAHSHLVDCVECDACQIAFRDGHFEAVILRFSLHHIEETQAALKEIHRILAPGGKVLAGEWLVEKEDQPRDGCYRFTLAEIEQLLQEAAFHQVEIDQVETNIVLAIAVK
ncbi:MAG: class I SAM-dependent methyltransferase [Chloroflexota bacterium]